MPVTGPDFFQRFSDAFLSDDIDGFMTLIDPDCTGRSWPPVKPSAEPARSASWQSDQSQQGRIPPKLT